MFCFVSVVGAVNSSPSLWVSEFDDCTARLSCATRAELFIYSALPPIMRINKTIIPSVLDAFFSIQTFLLFSIKIIARTEECVNGVDIV